jgi:hypothetical protein
MCHLGDGSDDVLDALLVHSLRRVFLYIGECETRGARERKSGRARERESGRLRERESGRARELRARERESEREKR